jgi:hypothetical protein
MFVVSTARNFNLLLKIQEQNKKSKKHIAVDEQNKAFLKVPLPGQPNLAGRYL